MAEVGMGCLEAEEGGRVLGFDLHAERRRKMEWFIWKKCGAAVSWEDIAEARRKRDPPAWP